MKRFLIIVALLILTVSAASAAPPAGKKPAAGAQADDSRAEKACRAERGTTALTIAAFTEKWGTNKNKMNAFGKCVSSKSKGEGEDEDEAEEDENGKANAAKKCKTERGTTAASIAAFTERHGTNKNKKNAFGKCVSKLAKKA